MLAGNRCLLSENYCRVQTLWHNGNLLACAFNISIHTVLYEERWAGLEDYDNRTDRWTRTRIPPSWILGASLLSTVVFTITLLRYAMMLFQNVWNERSVETSSLKMEELARQKLCPRNGQVFLVECITSCARIC